MFRVPKFAHIRAGKLASQSSLLYKLCSNLFSCCFLNANNKAPGQAMVGGGLFGRMVTLLFTLPISSRAFLFLHCIFMDCIIYFENYFQGWIPSISKLLSKRGTHLFCWFYSLGSLTQFKIVSFLSGVESSASSLA